MHDVSTYDLVIFDCDGVLVDSERLTVVEESRMLTELGWPMGPEEVVSRFMGRSLASEVAEISERLGPEAAGRFERDLVPRLAAVFDAEPTAIEGVHELLDALHERGTPVCVASSGTPEGIRRKLEQTGLRHHFGDRISSASRWSTASRRRRHPLRPDGRAAALSAVRERNRGALPSVVPCVTVRQPDPRSPNHEHDRPREHSSGP